jgi:diguanylate cyclase (GGDEF)-like protein/PAS domain S-box-containing protein
MNFNPFSVYVLLCGGMSIAIAYYAWRRPAAFGARAFSAFMLALSIYIIGYAMELASPDLAGMLFWSKVEYIGILSFPALFIVFAAQYAGRDGWLSRRLVVLLFVVPAVMFFFKLFDERLHLIYSGAAVDVSGAIPLLVFQRGPLYLLVTAYNILLLTSGNLLLLGKWRSASPLYRRQAGIMLAAALVIYGVYLYYLSGAPVIPCLKGLDINPFAYTLWGLAVGWAIFRYRLFDLAPVARDALIEALRDGVVVLDSRTRVVDANPEACRLFGWREEPIGRSADEAMAGWIDGKSLAGLKESSRQEARISKGGVERFFDVALTTLKDKDGWTIGYLVVVHDITGRKNTERRLRESSLTDELTGLNNRRGFRLLAGQLLQVALRMRMNAVLFYIDLDGLKQINDVLGHAAGDRALIEAGDLLKQSFRASDVTARLGGDEFVVLAVESDKGSRQAMLARMKEELHVRNAQPQRAYRLSLSIGAARFEWQHPDTLDVLLEAADQAMYKVKQARSSKERGRVIVDPGAGA